MFSARQASLGLFRQQGERGLVIDRDIGQNLAVDCHSSLIQAVDHSAVGQTAFTRGGIDACNPQGAELALPLAAVTVGILTGLDDALGSYAEDAVASTTMTLGLIDNFFVSGAGGDATFYSWHSLVPRSLTVGQQTVKSCHIGLVQHRVMTQVPFPL